MINRRKFLQFMTAILPAWLLAKIMKTQPPTVVTFGSSSGSWGTVVSAFIDGVVYDMTAITQPSDDEVFVGPQPGWKPLVRMDADGYHIYQDGETFSITSEGIVKS